MDGLQWHIIPLAFLLDWLLGDPPFLPHPVRWMGKAISNLESPFRKISRSLLLNGAVFSVFLVVAIFVLTALMLEAAQAVHPMLRTVLEILLIYYAISIRSLESSAMAVSDALNKEGLSSAREKVSHIVGRDTESLDNTGIAGGAVESVAENLVDGVISPLLYACIGGAPLAMAFKMINTLDSMIGYKNEKYEQFGKVAARLDDLANYLPARLSIPVISIAAQLLSGKGMSAFKTAVSEGTNHTSPNAGYPEAAFAGALEVKLNGPNIYGGKLVEKPFVGIRFNRPEVFHIKKACDLMMLSAFLWFILVWLVNILLIAST
ncbi:MAG TPA: cobalamin biosynthesis protein CobD [Deltaproteobacteria bacterium]|nr:cobalamin biosynthesis protein CobD [Deltaproteobacteria bacterium]